MKMLDIVSLLPVDREPEVTGASAPAFTAGWRRTLLGAAAMLVVLLAFVNLTRYPAIWFDEGIHLHVPKTLVMHGVYADVSSEGFRYYGPTMSVGPTVMLPVALAFKAFGIGLLQARLVIVAFLLAVFAGSWFLGRRLGGPSVALLGLALLVSSRGVDIFYYGRQVLGEVPAQAFLLAGLLCWLSAWDRPSWWRLGASGVLFGLAIVTKYQFLIVLGPGLTLAWVLDRTYYRVLSHQAFLWPLAIMGAIFAGWQAVALVYLGPALAGDNLRMMQSAAADAALTLSPERMARALRAVLAPSVFSCLLLPAIGYSAVRGLERSRASFRWMVIVCLVCANLGWFVLASIGWRRYAFSALALGALLVARLILAVVYGTDGRRWRVVRAAVVAVTVLTIAAPTAITLRNVLWPPPPFAEAMAAHLDAHVPADALIETWEPEMGFFTDHRYHYPPPRLLMTAVAARSGAPGPAEAYDFRRDGLPDYVLVGPFAQYVGVYPHSRLEGVYALVATHGAYQLYARRPL